MSKYKEENSVKTNPLIGWLAHCSYKQLLIKTRTKKLENYYRHFGENGAILPGHTGYRLKFIAIVYRLTFRLPLCHLWQIVL